MTANELRTSVARVVNRLDAPLSDAERHCGWTEESRVSMLVFFRRMLTAIDHGEDLRANRSYSSIARGLDHWGISCGEMLQDAAKISSIIRALK